MRKASAGGGMIQSGRGPGVTLAVGLSGSGEVPGAHALPFTHSYPNRSTSILSTPAGSP